MPRLSYDESLVALTQRGILGEEERPKLAPTMPSPLDEDPRLSFFRTRVKGDLSGLSIPRTLFCRSEICDCSFVGTDLNESFLCWNDFTDVDFSSAVLRGSDLRASIYTRVRFSGADLSGADLRRTTFHECDFTGAVMIGTKAVRSLSSGLAISPEQKKQIDWSLFSGDEPPGG
jgi:hypothetical protein